jgi:hypothetical protein
MAESDLIRGASANQPVDHGAGDGRGDRDRHRAGAGHGVMELAQRADGPTSTTLLVLDVAPPMPSICWPYGSGLPITRNRIGSRGRIGGEGVRTKEYALAGAAAHADGGNLLLRHRGSCIAS